MSSRFQVVLLLVCAIGWVGVGAHPESLECGTDATTRLKLGAKVMQGAVCILRIARTRLLPFLLPFYFILWWRCSDNNSDDVCTHAKCLLIHLTSVGVGWLPRRMYPAGGRRDGSRRRYRGDGSRQERR